MLKKIIPFILIFCLLFATAVMAEDVPMGRGNRPQGGPPEGFNPGNGEFTPPEGFDPSQRPDFGNGTPPEGFNPGNREVAPPENKGAPVTETAQPQKEKTVEAPAEDTKPAENNQQKGNMPNRAGGWNGNMFGQQQTAQEQPTGFKLLLQQYFTPAISVILLI